MKYQSIKGTKDILPTESYKWQFVENTIRGLMHAFNYREIRTPVFEQTSLFARSIGESTDIVTKEMYTFHDRGNESLTLRPEITASVIRSYNQHNLGQQQPLVKVYYICPMFRQERPQAGRLRQFHQFGAEAIGTQHPEIDAEIIALNVAIYQAFQLRNTILKINSLGCEKCRPAYKERLQKYLKPMLPKLSTESQRRFKANPLRILDSKDENDQKLTAEAPLMKDYLSEECSTHFESLQKELKNLGLDFEIDGRIVRGLDYYTKTAFEIISRDLGSQDALSGGGRYDLLIKELDGKATPGVGFAAGMERLLMVLEKQHFKFDGEPTLDVFIAPLDDPSLEWALKKAIELRNKGINVELDFLRRSLKAQMREADRQQAKYVFLIGENELKENKVTMKNMKTGEQRSVHFDQILEILRPT